MNTEVLVGTLLAVAGAAFYFVYWKPRHGQVNVQNLPQGFVDTANPMGPTADGSHGYADPVSVTLTPAEKATQDKVKAATLGLTPGSSEAVKATYAAVFNVHPTSPLPSTTNVVSPSSAALAKPVYADNFTTPATPNNVAKTDLPPQSSNALKKGIIAPSLITLPTSSVKLTTSLYNPVTKTLATVPKAPIISATGISQVSASLFSR